MLKNNLITIIIPVYNVSEYIHECIESIINQTDNRYECLFIDDCGTDNSIEIIERYINTGKIKNSKIIYGDINRGLSAARNIGIKHATSNYLLFLDSDDFLDRNAVKYFCKEIEKNQYDIITANYQKTPSNIISRNKSNTSIFITNESIKDAYYNNGFNITAWNKVVKKEFIEKNNLLFYENIIHEDVLWTFKIMHNANSLCIIPEITYYYRERNDSIMTKTFGKKNIDSIITILSEMYSDVKKFPREHKIIDYCDKKTLEFIIVLYANCKQSNFLETIRIIKKKHKLRNINKAGILSRCLLVYPSSFVLNLLLKTKYNYITNKK